MFTGLVQAVGELRARRPAAGGGALVEVAWPVEPAEPLALGESVAVSGVCLTATSTRGPLFTADLSAESLRLTTLGRLAPGAPVNLERALRPIDRLGGHLVQGHVDGAGRVARLVPAGDGFELAVECPAALVRYVVRKGSIAVDGVSLTVAGIEGRRFQCAVVPHTARSTLIGRYRPGVEVNLEIDLVARYLESLLAPLAGAGPLEQWLRGSGPERS